MLCVISASVANLPLPFEEGPELIDTDRCLPKPDIVAVTDSFSRSANNAIVSRIAAWVVILKRGQRVYVGLNSKNKVFFLCD